MVAGETSRGGWRFQCSALPVRVGVNPLRSLTGGHTSSLPGQPTGDVTPRRCDPQVSDGSRSGSGLRPAPGTYLGQLTGAHLRSPTYLGGTPSFPAVGPANWRCDPTPGVTRCR